MKSGIVFLVVMMNLFTSTLFGQQDTCINQIVKHEIKSIYLNEVREYWVSYPINYDTAKTYPVLYVLDGQWRFDLIRSIAYDLSGNKKIPSHIIIGLPHEDWRKNRGLDYTFSQSRNEYDNEKVDSLTYNATNSGGGENFYLHLTKEVMISVDSNYPTNDSNILIGHSYGGYFGSYILSRENRFKSYQLYDPSIWFSNGEAIEIIKMDLPKNKEIDIFISYQPIPKFHANKIKELINLISEYSNISLKVEKYENETHNSLFMLSFIDGMKNLYENWNEKN